MNHNETLKKTELNLRKLIIVYISFVDTLIAVHIKYVEIRIINADPINN